MSGPNNFLVRVNKELGRFDLPPYKIINPSPNLVGLLNDDEFIKVGRIDGANYYRITTTNLYNLILQRRPSVASFLGWLKYLPECSTIPLNAIFNGFFNRFSKQVQQKSDVVVFQSDLSKKMQLRFVGDYFSDKPHTTILNGVPTDIFNPGVMPTSALDGSPKLVITASFRLHKRVQDAILLTSYLRKQYPNIKLHVIGEMDVLTRAYVEVMNLSHVVFHGKVAAESLPEIYTACDIGLSPSIFDPCPNSVAEMIGCGLPVITVKESGASELIGVEDLIIPEELELEFYELQTAERLPSIDIKRWANAVGLVLDRPEYYSEKMGERVEKDLDIRVTARRYADFILMHNHG